MSASTSVAPDARSQRASCCDERRPAGGERRAGRDGRVLVDHERALLHETDVAGERAHGRAEPVEQERRRRGDDRDRQLRTERAHGRQHAGGARRVPEAVAGDVDGEHG